MKKILILPIVLLMCYAFAPSGGDPVILKAVGEYLPASCVDSLDVPLSTGENLTITKTTITGGFSTQYRIQGSGSGISFDVKIKDVNGGSVVAGDDIRMNSCSYTICSTAYSLRTGSVYPTFTVSGDTVRVWYTDCILPLNGTSGSFRSVWLQ